jgi:hypothetical protein
MELERSLPLGATLAASARDLVSPGQVTLSLRLIQDHALKTTLNEVSCQLHTPATVPLGKGPPSTHCIRGFLGEEKYSLPLLRLLGHPARSPVTILTELIRPLLPPPPPRAPSHLWKRYITSAVRSESPAPAQYAALHGSHVVPRTPSSVCVQLVATRAAQGRLRFSSRTNATDLHSSGRPCRDVTSGLHPSPTAVDRTLSRRMSSRSVSSDESSNNETQFNCDLGTGRSWRRVTRPGDPRDCFALHNVTQNLRVL